MVLSEEVFPIFVDVLVCGQDQTGLNFVCHSLIHFLFYLIILTCFLTAVFKLLVILMDQFSFQAGINECLKSCMENPITKGPTPRWQRKLQAQSRGVPLSPVNIGNQSKRKLSSTTLGTSKNKNPPTKKTPGITVFEQIM